MQEPVAVSPVSQRDPGAAHLARIRTTLLQVHA
jgi:hypothetical protein